MFQHIARMPPSCKQRSLLFFALQYTLGRPYSERQCNERSIKRVLSLSIQRAKRSPLSTHSSAQLRLFTFSHIIRYIVLRMMQMRAILLDMGLSSCRRCIKPFGSRAARYIDDLVQYTRYTILLQKVGKFYIYQLLQLLQLLPLARNAFL